MFRLPPQVSPAEEAKRVRADVRNNFITFTVMCVAIKISSVFLDKVMA